MIFTGFFVDRNIFFLIFLILSINYGYRKYSQNSQKKHNRGTKTYFFLYRKKAYFLSSGNTQSFSSSLKGKCISYYSAFSGDWCSPSSHPRWSWWNLWNQSYLRSSGTYEMQKLQKNPEFWFRDNLPKNIWRSKKTRIHHPRTFPIYNRKMPKMHFPLIESNSLYNMQYSHHQHPT